MDVALDDDGRLLAQAEGTQVPLDWSAVEPASILELGGAGRPDPAALVGAAVLAYRAGDVAGAESLLGRAVAREGALQQVVNPVIARGRGEPADPDGYRLVDGRFLTMREIRLAARAKELARDVRRLLERPENAREAAIEEVAARGSEEVEALVIALREEARSVVERLDGDAFRKQWEKVANQRRALDDARTHALALIFDEERYFYPYKPPAVTVARAREYAAVQREVDERVGSVIELWQEGDKPLRVPKRVSDRLADVQWLLATLQGFGEPLRGAEATIDWVLALPEADVGLHVQSFCWNTAERQIRDEWDRIDRFNERKLEALHPGERTVIRITNAYRTMLGRPPLPVNPKLCAAARAHAEEMALMGYFSHFSPTPGRRTPFDRMRLAGYEEGASENIANHPGAESAHVGWIHSSGHHRNLLSLSHQEFGVGNSGRLWVQNFGRGAEYRADPDWSAD